MSFESFLRFLWSPAIGLIIGIGIVWLIVWILRRTIPANEETVGLRKGINTGGVVLTIILLAVFVLSAINSASVNVVDRSSIDRNNVDQQDQRWQQEHSK